MTKARIIGTAILITIICFSYTTNALAATKFSLIEPKSWTTGTKADVSDSSDGVTVSLEPTGEVSKGINAAYIFSTKVSYPDSTSALKFHIKQYSTSNLWMDFIVEDAKGNKKTLSVDGAAIIHRDDSSSEQEIIKLKDLSLNLGINFNGDVYIPFRYLKIANSDGSSSNFDMKNLNSSGFVFTTNGSSKIEVTDLKLLSEEEDPYLKLKLDANIVGEDSLPIADVQEAISKYSIQGSQKDDFSFVPIDGIPGVSLTEDGVFTTNANASQQGVKIKAINKDGLYIYKMVYIYKSWISTQDDQKLKLPQPDQIKPIENNYNIFSNEKVLIGIRLSCIMAAFIFGLSYCLSHRKFKD